MAVEEQREQFIHHWFESQVEQTPDAIAVIDQEQHLTYAELNQRANCLAHHLRTLNVGPERRVGIYMERSLDLVVAIWAVLKTGGAYVPITPLSPPERLAYILEDAEPIVLLTQQNLMAALPAHEAEVICLDTLAWIVTDQSVVASDLDLDHLAYIIYTSGSTGKPKGVLITHRGLINYLTAVIRPMKMQAADRLLFFASISFDASTEELFPPLMQGAGVVLRPADIMTPGHEFTQLIEQQGVTILSLPTAFWHEWVYEMVQAQTAVPAAVRMVLVNAEEPSPEILVLWQTLHTDHIQWINTYGPTEITVSATFYTAPTAKGEWNPQHKIPIGKPLSNTNLYVLDAQLNSVPTGVAGELYIGGGSLARGYLKRPRLTAAAYVPNPFSAEPGARLYKTGDMVRYLADGNLEFLERVDHQVKIRGYRVELGEIESILSRHTAVRRAVVLLREDVPGDKRLVAYVVSNPAQQLADENKTDGSTFITDLQQLAYTYLPEYMVPTAYVILDALPLTTSGKLDRRALPLPTEHDRPQRKQPFVAPQTETETTLADIWCEILNIKQVGIHDNFFEIGGHSLLAARIVTRVRELFAIELSVRHVFELPTIARLSQALGNGRTTETDLIKPSIQPVPREQALPLSFAQQRLWFLDQLDEGATTYNISTTLDLHGFIQIDILKQSLAYLIDRHETLRTTFKEANGQPTQNIAAILEIALPLIDLSTSSAESQSAEVEKFVQTDMLARFDLENGPLLRTHLLRLEAERHLLIITMHHIISDGLSEEIFVRELFAVYEALNADRTPDLPELSVQYADFAVWQRQWLQGKTLQPQLDYWRQHLAGAPPLLELPTDRIRPSIQTFNGASQQFTLSRLQTDQLEELGQQFGATLYMTVLAAFATLLFRYSDQEDIVLGTPIGNRHHQQLESLIGFFVNTLVLRINFQENPRFSELLTQVRRLALDAYDHQDLPFEQLVDALQPERNLSHTPLFQVMFVWQNQTAPTIECSGLTVTHLPVASLRLDFDLLLSMEETANGLVGNWVYRTDLFDATTLTRLTAHLQNLLAAIVTHPQKPISELPLLTAEERQKLLVEWNHALVEKEAQIPPTQCMHSLFERQAEQTPNATAIVCQGQHLTYAELNQRANQLAHYLRSLGVEPEVRVGLCVERSVEMVIGILGILKAGGAYVPADPGHPPSRIAYMFTDAHVSLILTQESLRERLPTDDSTIICLDTIHKQIDDCPISNPSNHTMPQNLMYIVYTSGTTGKPKGVLVEHHGVTNVTVHFGNVIKLQANDRCLQFSSVGFDVATQEIFTPLLKGAALIIHPTLTQLSTLELLQFFHEQSLTVVTLSVAFWQQWVQDLANRGLQLPGTLRVFMTGGESPSMEKIKLWASLLTQPATFLSAYGPTEASITTAVYQETNRALKSNPPAKIPLGRPLPNTHIYVFDAYQQPVPIGVAGELYIGGVGVARGYLNDARLTSEKFVVNESGERLYKTGDMARYLPDGTLEFLGRKDHQVKIRGFRIELGEIEAILMQHAQIRQAVAMVRQDHAHHNRLVAYLVLEPEADINSSELRHLLHEQLPDYMVPSVFVKMEKFPLNTSGKIDLQALPGAEAFVQDQEASFVPPSTPTEKTLAAIWADVLTLSSVGAYSHFFELGGHSLLATQVMARMRASFNLDLPLRVLFQKPVLAELANWIDEAELESVEDDTLARLLAEVNEMPDDEIAQMLSNFE